MNHRSVAAPRTARRLQAPPRAVLQAEAAALGGLGAAWPWVRPAAHRLWLARVRIWAAWIGLFWAGAEGGAAGVAGSPWGGFVEQDFPFFGSVVDGRRLGEGFPEDNLTPRALVLNLGQGCWAAFDLDLLRVAAVWEGSGLTPVSMAQGSYHEAGRKAPEGQDPLPTPVGRVWWATGCFPGVQCGEIFRRTDPRQPGPDAREVGRGALPDGVGRFRWVDVGAETAGLGYEVEGVGIEERWSATPGPRGPLVRRRFSVGASTRPLWVALGQGGEEDAVRGGLRVRPGAGQSGDAPELVVLPGGLRVVRVPAWPDGGTFEVSMGPGWEADVGGTEEPPAAGRRWTEEVVTSGRLAEETEAYVVDRVPLPVVNPWRRNVRLADVAFRRDGVAFGVTFDGDVWAIRGLSGRLTEVRWRRFTSGLHEPLGICVRGEDVFVHDRNGLWRLVDEDGNGEADRHQLFSTLGSQSAETREFASGLRLMPDGSFVVAKGGQRGATLGGASGSVLRVSSDGGTVTVLGHGFRQPFLGVHPREGWVSVSDQQGHYVPTTPLYVLGAEDAYHGFLPLILPKNRHREPIEEPLVWIPHAVNASGSGQVWLEGARMGPLSGAWIHLGYFRPEAFVVLWQPGLSGTQGAVPAVISLTREFAFAPLAGAVGPLDGELYVAGFQIWGTTATETSGLARVRYTGREMLLPVGVEAWREGVVLRFDVDLDAWTANDPASFSVERWNYVRSADYGSPHYRLDGSKGHEVLTVTGARLSTDRRSVFLRVSDMREVMQMRVGWSLRTAGGRAFARSAYLTPKALGPHPDTVENFGPAALGSGPNRGGAAEVLRRVDAAEGQRVAELMGCVACHSVDGTTLGKVGPTWKGLWGSVRRFADGTRGVADEGYIRDSIRQPSRRVVDGYQASDAGMPSYEGVLTQAQEDALIRYIESVR